jgi:hypothetical protein
MENNTSNENTENTESTETMDAEGAQIEAEATEEQKSPAWVEFSAALNAHCQALGLDVQDQVGFIKFTNKETGHKLYVAKQGRLVKRVDTTLPILGVVDGTYPLDKPNGKIECHIVAELDKVTAALTLLADSATYGKIRAAKRAPKAEVAESTEAEATESEATEA